MLAVTKRSTSLLSSTIRRAIRRYRPNLCTFHATTPCFQDTRELLTVLRKTSGYWKTPSTLILLLSRRNTKILHFPSRINGDIFERVQAPSELIRPLWENFWKEISRGKYRRGLRYARRNENFYETARSGVSHKIIQFDLGIKHAFLPIFAAFQKRWSSRVVRTMLTKLFLFKRYSRSSKLIRSSILYRIRIPSSSAKRTWKCETQ